MRKFTTRDMTLAAVLAAVYAVLTIVLPIPQYGPIQIRLAEALTVLPSSPPLRRDWWWAALLPTCSPPTCWT